MDVLTWIIVGLVAGLLASLVMGGVGYGILGDIIVGILGALLGGWLFARMGWGTPFPGHSRSDLRRLHWRGSAAADHPASPRGARRAP